VTQCGRICLGRRKINLSQVFAGQNVGIKEIADKIWLGAPGRIEPTTSWFVVAEAALMRCFYCCF
jgi:hypothetical protein